MKDFDLTKGLAVLLMSLLTAVCALGVSSVQSLTTSVNALNEKMAVVMSSIADYKGQLRDHDERLRKLELQEINKGK